MVSVIQRARKLQALLSIRLGPGAAILPPEVSRIHLDFVTDVDNAAKKFWRTCLPRLKYHNPAIPMTVTRTTIKGNPSTMTIHFTSAAAAGAYQPAVSPATNSQTSSAPPSKTKAGAPIENTQVINMKNRTVSEILTQLMKLTKAQPIRATADETRQIRELEEFQDKSAEVRERMAKVTEERKREEAILTQARGEVEAMKDN